MYFIRLFFLVFLTTSLFAEKKVGPLRVGLVLPLTGSLRVFGEEAHLAAKASVRAFNAKGDYRIALFVADSQSNGKKAKEVTERLFKNNRIHLVISGTSSRLSQEIAKVACESKIGHISPVKPRQFQMLKPCTWVVSANDSMQNQVVLKALKSASKPLYVVVDPRFASDGFLQRAKKILPDLKIEEVGFLGPLPKNHAIYVHSKRANFVELQFERLAVGSEVYLRDVALLETQLETLSQRFSITHISRYSEVVKRGQNQSFLQAMRSQGVQKPSVFSVAVYDSISLAGAMLQTAKSTRAAVIKQVLNQGFSFQGLVHELSLTDHFVDGGLLLGRWSKGRFQVLSL